MPLWRRHVLQPVRRLQRMLGSRTQTALQLGARQLQLLMGPLEEVVASQRCLLELEEEPWAQPVARTRMNSVSKRVTVAVQQPVALLRRLAMPDLLLPVALEPALLGPALLGQLGLQQALWPPPPAALLAHRSVPPQERVSLLTRELLRLPPQAPALLAHRPQHSQGAGQTHAWQWRAQAVPSSPLCHMPWLEKPKHGFKMDGEKTEATIHTS